MPLLDPFLPEQLFVWRNHGPPDTNTPKQARGHRVPLIGMAALVFVVMLGFLWFFNRSTEGRDEVPAMEEAPFEQPAPQPN